MRTVVEHSSPTVIGLQVEINKLSEAYEKREKIKADADKFEALFKKSLKDPSSLTPDERVYLDREVKATTEALKHHLSEGGHPNGCSNLK